MAATEALVIVRLEEADAAAALLLSTEAHWNQNEADWRLFLTRGIVFGVRDPDGRLIASAALLPYSSTDAWISMVLVTPSWRRRGVATRLIDACLATARKLGLTAWLDATPAGAAVYGPLGFTPGIELRRLRLDNAAATTRAPLPGSDLGGFILRDARAMGFERSALLRELAGRAGSSLVANDDAAALVRGGRTARYIGPVFADASDSALALVDAITQRETGPLLIDAVASQDAFVRELTDAGWKIERPFLRMRFGGAAAPDTVLPFAVAGPEYG